MIESGDVYLAGVNQEQRVTVLVVSVGRFNQIADRVLVAPELPGFDDDVLPPWRIEADGAVFALDLVRSLSTDRLLERTGRISAPAAAAVRRAMHHIV